MRTTFNTVSRNTQYLINDRFSDLAKLQQKLASGKELFRPSDGPTEVANVLKLKTQMSQLNQYNRNIEDGLAWMEVTDTTMMSMNTTLQKARELAIRGNNDSLDNTQRKYIADELELLTRGLVNLVNTQYKGDFIFSGSHTNKDPLLVKESGATSHTHVNQDFAFFNGTGGGAVQLQDPNGGVSTTPISKVLPGSLEIRVGGILMEEGVDYTVDYIKGELTPINSLLQEDFLPGTPEYDTLEIELDYLSTNTDIYNNPINTDTEILRQIEEDISVGINTTFADLAVDQDTDIFTSMILLGESLLNTNRTESRDGILESIGKLDASIDNLLSLESSNGANINYFVMTLDRNEDQNLEVDRIRQSLEDADYAQVVSDYTIAQTVFNAALSSTAQIMQLSLADYIR